MRLIMEASILDKIIECNLQKQVWVLILFWNLFGRGLDVLFYKTVFHLD